MNDQNDTHMHRKP